MIGSNGRVWPDDSTERFVMYTEERRIARIKRIKVGLQAAALAAVEQAIREEERFAFGMVRNSGRRLR